jgi:Tol biopolymer transport system component
MSYRRTGVAGLVMAGLLAASATATPPGNNGLIGWQRETPSGFPQLRVANPDGSNARTVFPSPPRRGDLEITFSPTDPDLAFFTRFGMGPFSADLFRGNLATGRVRRLGRPQSADIAPTVSPDGNTIAYFGVARPRDLDREGPSPPERINLIGVNGGNHRVITPRNLRGIDPDWSPDGARFVYTEARLRRPAQIQNRLAVMNVDGTGRRPLTRYGGPNEVNGKWMPDGQTIVFEQLRDRGSRSDIASISASGGPIRKILRSRRWETNPIPSPDGTRILFSGNLDRRGGGRLGDNFELYTVAVDGTGLDRITNNRRPDIFPDWQRLP